MTIDDFLIRETDHLVLPEKTFYPLKIPIAHPQLRHFINAPDADLIYYASGHDIYCLNTETRARTHIYHVPFDCRCTAAGYGWICVAGGDKGNFTVIQLDAVEPEASGDVDAHLPVGLNERPIGRPGSRWREPRVRTESLGLDIINSITIHKLEADDEHPVEEIVAVVTSNDRTIRMYSLSLGRQVASLELPFPMNHASISPDGELLLAVGDYNQAYFFERMRDQDWKWSAGSSKAEHWEVMNIVQLHCPKDLVSVGYFTTAWSPSGGLCAVGSECGYVSVFDTELIRTADWGEDAIVEVVESTRPENRAGPGAIRSMVFSPHPWDLLIWAEDRGRVVIADIRAGLRVRQVIKLDAEGSGVKKAQTQDFSIGARYLDPMRTTHDDNETSTIQGQLRALSQQVENLRQYRMALDADVDLAAASMSTEYLELLSERRRLQRLAAAVEEDPNGLTVEERQILDALRTNDPHGSARDFGGTAAHIRQFRNTVHGLGSRDSSHSSLGSRNDSAHPTHSRTADGSATSQNAERRSTALRTGVTQVPGDERTHVPSLSMLQGFLWERDNETPRALHQPRRQASLHPNTSSRNDSDSRAVTIPPYAQSVNNHGSLMEARHIIESQWARSPSALSSMTTTQARPQTPPPHVASPTNYTHLLDDSRPSTADSARMANTNSDDRTVIEPSNPLRRRTPGLRAIEAHHQTISQLRHQGSFTNTRDTATPAPASLETNSTTGAPASLFTSGAIVRPTTSSSSGTSPSPPATSSATIPARRVAATLRERSHSRVSDRLSDYEARVRYMSRYADAQTLSFLHRQSGRYESPEWGDKSAGLAMSGDGRKLWCASERGILEVDVDLWSRRMLGAEKFA